MIRRRRAARTVATTLALLLGVSVVTALSGRTGAGAATGDGDGSFGGDGTTATISVWANAGDGGEVHDADDPDGPRPFSTRATPDPRQPSDPIAGICPAIAPDGTVGFGWPYTIDTIDNRTGLVVASRRICVALDPADPSGTPALPPEPEPPTYGEVWRAAAIAAPSIGVNPIGEGVTGLDTRLWAAGADRVQISVRIRGYLAVGEARRVAYWFAPGDGSPIVANPAGGSAADPAAEHIYERRGTYRLQAGALWEATVVIDGPNVPARSVDLGRALLVVARDYRVVEIRGRITR